MRKLKTTAAVSLIIAFWGVLAWFSVSRRWDQGEPSRIPAFGLLVLLVTWIIGWYIWNLFEKRKDPNWLGYYSNSGGSSRNLTGKAVSLLMALGFTSLFPMVGNVPYVIGVFGMVVLKSAIGDHFIISRLRREKEKLLLTDAPELTRYYLDRPHLLLHCLQLTLCILAAVLYAAAESQSEFTRITLAYGMLGLSIIINEIVLWCWRLVRIKHTDPGV